MASSVIKIAPMFDFENENYFLIYSLNMGLGTVGSFYIDGINSLTGTDIYNNILINDSDYDSVNGYYKVVLLINTLSYSIMNTGTGTQTGSGTIEVIFNGENSFIANYIYESRGLNNIKLQGLVLVSNLCIGSKTNVIAYTEPKSPDHFNQTNTGQSVLINQTSNTTYSSLQVIQCQSTLTYGALFDLGLIDINTTNNFRVVGKDGVNNNDYIDISLLVECTVSSCLTIVTHLLSQTINNGDNLLLSVIATGDSLLTYQWRLNGNLIVGANSSTYTTNSTFSNSYYDVIVSNNCGTITSNDAIITITELCELIQFNNGLLLPMAKAGEFYSHIVSLLGNSLFVLNVITKLSWLNISIDVNDIVFSGTLNQNNIGNSNISVNISNCNNSNTISINTILVIQLYTSKANNDVIGLLNKGSNVNSNISINDSICSGNASNTYSLIGNSLVGLSNVTLNTNGSFTATLITDFTGIASFSYNKLCNGIIVDTALVSIVYSLLLISDTLIILNILTTSNYTGIACLNSVIKLYEDNVLFQTVISNNSGQYNFTNILSSGKQYTITQTCLNKSESHKSNISCLGVGNELLTILVKKNNCSSLKEGSTINYLVVANTYFGCTQEYANALAYISTLEVAQNYVNSNGKCLNCIESETCDCEDVSILQVWQSITGNCNLLLKEKIKILMNSKGGKNFY